MKKGAKKQDAPDLLDEYDFSKGVRSKHAQHLENGEHLTQPEFHCRYLNYPDHFTAELVGGIVYLTPRVRVCHGSRQPDLNVPLFFYSAATPGSEVASHLTIILGPASEPQPDLVLLTLPEWGGQSCTNDEGFLAGAPELVAEVAYSTRSLELYEKKLDYQRAGVKEYLVLCIEEKELYWFDFQLGRSIKPNRQGILRSRVFPGLWIDPQAMMDRDSSRIMAVAQQGIASREHATFVKRLQTAHRKQARG